MLKKRLMTILIFLVSVMMGCTASPDTPVQETQAPEQTPAGKVKVENVTVKSQSPDIPFMFSFDLPSGWTYRITADDAENKILTVSVWPEDQDEDAGNIVIVSGQTDLTQCATDHWDNCMPHKRMESRLTGEYSH